VNARVALSTAEQVQSREALESKWSQANANGFYWWRYNKDNTPEPATVRDGVFYCAADPDPTSVSVGEFLGPITPSTTERVIRLREALEPLVVRLTKMMENGPDCECEPEGHICGWPALQRELAAARAALQPKAETEGEQEK
jgi:hypothetical protein